MDKIFRSMGLKTEILTQDWNLKKPCHSWDRSFILYHYSIGSRLPYKFLEWEAPFVLRFHNISPLAFFSDFTQEEQTLNACQLGIQQIPMLVEKSKGLLPVSLYNAKALGTDKASTVLPILRDYRSFEKKPSVEKTKDTQLLFVGRLSPNKCQHDLIEIFALYKQFYDAHTRLILVGSSFSQLYKNSLIELARTLNLTVNFNFENRNIFDLSFLSDLSEERLAQLYHESSLFICMSEHEGFCVPLVEAMFAQIPILAHRSSAIADTLNGCGMGVDKKDKKHVLESMNSLLKNKSLQQKYRELSLKQSEFYALPYTKKLLENFVINVEV